jgi:hypothetical protein
MLTRGRAFVLTAMTPLRQGLDGAPTSVGTADGLPVTSPRVNSVRNDDDYGLLLPDDALAAQSVQAGGDACAR